MQTALQQQQQTYQDLIQLFDLLDNVIKAIEHPGIKNRAQQLQMSEQFILVATQGLENILSAYVRHVKNGGKSSPEDIHLIESSAHNTFVELAKLADSLKKLRPAM